MRNLTTLLGYQKDPSRLEKGYCTSPFPMHQRPQHLELDAFGVSPSSLTAARFVRPRIESWQSLAMVVLVSAADQASPADFWGTII